MPHCIIEYSTELEAKLPPQPLMNAVFQGALASELFSVNDIKTRLYPCQHYMIAEESKPFIHVTTKILSGRTDEQKSILSNAILDRLKTLTSDIPAYSDLSLTVEVVDIDRTSYAKAV